MAWGEQIDEVNRRIDTTQSEIKVMFNIMRDQKTAQVTKQRHVDTVIVATQKHAESGKQPLYIHPAIKAKAHEFMRK